MKQRTWPSVPLIHPASIGTTSLPSRSRHRWEICSSCVSLDAFVPYSGVRTSCLSLYYSLSLLSGMRVAGDVVGWFANEKLEVLGALAAGPKGGQIFRVRSNTSAPWRDHLYWPFEESGTVLGFTLNSTSVYVAVSLLTLSPSVLSPCDLPHFTIAFEPL
jgi:hypothetical protein